ncbi:MAG: hypothetical protein FWF77_02650 [Defluviitaleaceae bacterium]|nr:hypothetical protein [Defluviitaleaceae bacterium]
MYEIENSAQIAMFYGGISLSADEIMNLEGKATKECLRYLTGKYCISEREKYADSEQISDMRKRLEAIFDCTYGNLWKIMNYADAIDRIRRLFADVADDILNGKTRLPSEETIALSRLKFHEINDVMMRLSEEKTSAKIIIREQIAMRQKQRTRGKPKKTQQGAPTASIKDTPSHDPDARLNALSYTIPSWHNMIEKAFDNSEIEKASPHARNKLAGELENISAAAKALREIISEVKP